MARRRKPGEMTEAQWERTVGRFARMFGYLRYHTQYSLGSTPGFPDDVLVRRKEGKAEARVIFAELKSDHRDPSEAQNEWLGALEDAGVEVYVWRPRDVDRVVEILRANQRPHEEAPTPDPY